MKPNLMKIAKIAIPIIGLAATAATNWLDDKKMDDRINEKVAEALKNQTKES